MCDSETEHQLKNAKEYIWGASFSAAPNRADAHEFLLAAEPVLLADSGNGDSDLIRRAYLNTLVMLFQFSDAYEFASIVLDNSPTDPSKLAVVDLYIKLVLHNEALAIIETTTTEFQSGEPSVLKLRDKCLKRHLYRPQKLENRESLGQLLRTLGKSTEHLEQKPKPKRSASSDKEYRIHPDADFADYVAFDIETTGFELYADIIEIAAVRIRNGIVIDEFQSFVKPERKVPPKATEVTGITDSDVETAPRIRHVLPLFIEFIGDDILVGHNAGRFDIVRLNRWARKCNLTINNSLFDTLPFARKIASHFDSKALGLLAQELEIPVGTLHRALDDARLTAMVFEKLRAL